MYFADVYGLQVGGSAVSLDAASVPVTAMIDSGTTYTYLPSALYGPLVARVSHQTPGLSSVTRMNSQRFAWTIFRNDVVKIHVKASGMHGNQREDHESSFQKKLYVFCVLICQRPPLRLVSCQRGDLRGLKIEYSLPQACRDYSVDMLTQVKTKGALLLSIAGPLALLPLRFKLKKSGHSFFR